MNAVLDRAPRMLALHALLCVWAVCAGLACGDDNASTRGVDAGVLRALDARVDEATSMPLHDAGARRDAAADGCKAECDASVSEDAGSAASADQPAQTAAASRGCPWYVSVTTRTYGTGDESQDDYAPRNVGAIWVTTSAGGFVRTLSLWGPGYVEYAQTWLRESHASRVDIATMATRSDHARPLEAEWDCQDSQGQVASAGDYRLNVEFTEAEEQGPLLRGDKALEFRIAQGAEESVRAPQGSFGEVRITPAAP